MSTLQRDIVEVVDSQLAALWRAPRMWGTTDEAIELHVIQLLEFRSIAIRPKLERREPRTVLNSYHGALANLFPGAPPWYLFDLVDNFNRKDEFILLLKGITERIIAEMQPEDVFATHDLVLRLWLREDVKAPRASTLSSYYDAFHRVLRAVSRKKGTRGRAGRDLEKAIDFALTDVEISPANGAPASITLPLDEVETTEIDAVKQGVAQIVAVNEWAADTSQPVDALTHAIAGEGAPERVAAQALRLMPSQEAAVLSVEFGGKLVKRPAPITIRPSHAERLVEIVEQSRTLRPFDEVGDVRAIDIDQRSFKIRKGNRSLRCWLEDAKLLSVAEAALRQRVRVIGHEYRDPGSPPVIIAERIVP